MATDLDANAATELWRRLTQAALAAESAAVTNRQGGKEWRSGGGGEAPHGARRGRRVWHAAVAESSVSLLVTECKETNALEALLREIATVRSSGTRRGGAGARGHGDASGWTNECSGELRSVLALVEVEHVDLSGTPLRGVQFARAFDGVTARALTSLRVAQCGLVDAQVAALWSVVPRLRLLDLRGNALTDGCNLLVQELLWSAALLEHLDVSGNKFSGEALADVGAVAMQLGTVETLLTGSTTVDAAATKRAAVQMHNAQRTLASLCALMRQPSGSMLDVSGARGLHRQLSLTLTSNASTPNASASNASSSGGGGTSSESSSSQSGVEWGGLETLVLAHAQLSSLAAMSGAIGTLRNLVSLSLRGNHFGELPRNLVMALADCPLASLDVSFNQLTVLPAALGRLSKLRFFRARGNRLQTVPSLAGGAPLHEIDLAQNEFSTWPSALDTAALAQCRRAAHGAQSPAQRAVADARRADAAAVSVAARQSARAPAAAAHRSQRSGARGGGAAHAARRRRAGGSRARAADGQGGVGQDDGRQPAAGQQSEDGGAQRVDRRRVRDGDDAEERRRRGACESVRLWRTGGVFSDTRVFCLEALGFCSW
jgi:hypothetical protein